MGSGRFQPATLGRWRSAPPLSGQSSSLHESLPAEAAPCWRSSSTGCCGAELKEDSCRTRTTALGRSTTDDACALIEPYTQALLDRQRGLQRVTTARFELKPAHGLGRRGTL